MQLPHRTRRGLRLPNCLTWFELNRRASRFSDGDNITVLEVRGTAETLMPGNFYWIKGTYSLGSHDRARLAVNITAKGQGQ